MIFKSMSRHGSASNQTQLIEYVTRYSIKHKRSTRDKEEATIILRHHLKSQDIEGMVKEFQQNESFRVYKRKNSAVLFHEVVSFAPGDKKFITDQILKDIAAKYVSLRAVDSLCLIVSHREKTAHTHLHAILSGVKLNGYSSRVSKDTFKRIVADLEKFQQEKYPELIHSKNQHRRNVNKSRDEILAEVKKTRQTKKEKLIKSLEDTYNKSNSSKDFFKRLCGKYEVYYRNDRLHGVILEGRRYRIARLGIDDEKLDALDRLHSSEHKCLSELQNIRKGVRRNRERSSATSRSIITPNSNELLEEISAIREKSHVEIEELRNELGCDEHKRSFDDAHDRQSAETFEDFSNALGFIKPKFFEREDD